MGKQAVLGAGAWVLVTGGCVAASVRRGRGCPVLDTAGSSQLQLTHHRAQLSPLAKVVASLGKQI